MSRGKRLLSSKICCVSPGKQFPRGDRPLLRSKKTSIYSPFGRTDGGRVRPTSHNATLRNLLTDSRILERKDAFRSPAYRKREGESEEREDTSSESFGNAWCSRLHFRVHIPVLDVEFARRTYSGTIRVYFSVENCIAYVDAECFVKHTASPKIVIYTWYQTKWCFNDVRPITQSS